MPGAARAAPWCTCVDCRWIDARAKMVGMADQTGPGRPFKWADNAERMRAYRVAQREQRDALHGDLDAVALARRVVELTGERDRLWAQVGRLQHHIAVLENTLAGHPTPAAPRTVVEGPLSGLSRAQRRQAERDQRRRQRPG